MIFAIVSVFWNGFRSIFTTPTVACPTIMPSGGGVLSRRAVERPMERPVATFVGRCGIFRGVDWGTWSKLEHSTERKGQLK